MPLSPRLGRLDKATRSKIRSTQILTSLPQIISELVENSLDAGAKDVEVGIHCGDWMCWVRDDGSGINKEGLSLIAQGIEGGRYASSKSYSLPSLEETSTFGFRGEALASAADLSCLEISSRTARSKESWSIILKGGERLYYGPSLRWRREGAGTTVSIRDAFFNLPVRRLSHPNAARTFELIRRDLETFALVFPHVRLTLRDLSKENSYGIDKSRVLTIPRTASALLTFRHLFGRALVEHVDSIDVHSGLMRIQGFLSLVGYLSKSHQFLYLNRHILDACELHRLIDKCFSSSTFAKHALDETGQPGTSRPGSRRSPRKGESHPVYVLNISVPRREFDNCLEPAKGAVHFQNQDAIVSFLADVIKSFLLRHGFKTSQTSNVSRSRENGSIKRRKVHEGDALDFSQDKNESAISTPCIALDGRREANEIVIKGTLSEDQHEELTWVDPDTGKVYSIDSRTGNSYLHGQRCTDPGGSRSHSYRAITDTCRWEKRRGSCQNTQDDGSLTPEWIRQALESNDAIALTDRAIPCLPSSKTMTEGPDERRIPWTRQLDEQFSVPLVSLRNPGGIPGCSLTKESLAGVQVLGQVDCKFIACLVDTSRTDENLPEGHVGRGRLRSLVLIDQHAADERIRVERFLKSLCIGYLDCEGVGVKTRTPDLPVPVLLTKFEHDRLMGSMSMRKAFQNWGFDIVNTAQNIEDTGTNQPDEDYRTIYFGSVPEVVADKLLSGSGNDLREVVKGYLARLEAESISDSTKGPREIDLTADEEDIAWLKALRHCPRELVELVNSKACRGAIMFNDPLDLEQCMRLLRQLSVTAFPFQCAHGRPSIVPLTTVDLHQSPEDSSMPRPMNWDTLIM